MLKRISSWRGIALASIVLVSIALASIALAGPLLAGGWLIWPDSKAKARPLLQIGYGDFSPYQISRPGGQPTGFAVQLVAEAARRIGQPLEWKRYKGSADQALQTREIQLFPMLALLPDRIGKVDFSPAWWENSMVVVSPVKAPILSQSDAAGKKVSLIHATFGLKRLKELFPDAIPVPSLDYRFVVSSVCRGEVAAGIMETRLANSLQFLDDCRGQQLTMKWFPQLNLRYAVAASKGYGPVANELFEEMMRMSQDGSMTRIGEPWGVSTSNQHNSVAKLSEAQTHQQFLLIFSGLTTFLCAVICWIAFRWRRASRAAEQALTARSQFIANVSHEIRTPLHGILGTAGLLEDSRLDSPQREHLRTIRDCGDLLLRQINDLLDMAKLEAGRLDLERVAYVPSDLVRATLQLHQAQAVAKGIDLSAAGTFSGSILGDPYRIQQILNNLVSNAIKFTAEGSVVLQAGERNGRFRYSVKDTGAGLSPLVQEKLFQPFVQADNSTARRFGGTGLGLTISQQLVHLMGGEIGLNSEEGKGSEFWFEVPFVPAQAPPVAVAASPSAPGGASILLVEDNLVNQRIATALLQKLGCTVTLAENGKRAVDAAQDRPFDVILMDCHMPEMDGFSATRAIRALSSPAARVPIIAVTAAAFEDDVRLAREAGMNDFLAKPFSKDQLASLLQRWAVPDPASSLKA